MGTGTRAVALLERLFRRRFARFAAVGTSGVIVNLAALWLASDVLGVREIVASAIAIEVSIVWNFLLNNAITYRDLNAYARADVGARLVRYNLVSVVGLALQLGAFVFLRLVAARAFGRDALGAWTYPAQCTGIALAMAWNFTANLRFTWSQTPPAGPVSRAVEPVRRAHAFPRGLKA
jgi:putative flippase GtrA